jgi:archaellum biogenesis ATPase FlaH
MYITREYPNKIIQKYDLRNVPYLWLTNVPEEHALRPTDTEKLRFAFRKHLKDNGVKKIILLDGVEYLITHNTFSSILKLLQASGDMVSMAKGTLLLPLSPATFQEQELKLLEREADKVIY